MRDCGWYLWLNGKKVRNIRELRENFDTAVLIGYFRGGSLLKWLSDLGEYDIVKRLSETDINGDIGLQLQYAFGVRDNSYTGEPSREYRNTEVTVPADTAANAGFTEVGICTGSFYGNIGSFYGDICSFTNTFIFSAPGSGGAVSSFYGAQTAAGIGFGSGNALGSGIGAGSYAALVSGQALNVSSGGSFTTFFNSFFRAGLSAYGAGSFSYYIGSYKIGSFNTFFGNFGRYGSYKGFYAGSFALSALSGVISGSGISGSGGSFGHIGGFFGEGSFYRSADGIVITAEEYHRTLINLSSCPLNAYGYGINLI